MSDTIQSYIHERGELLAKLVLTRRKDIEVGDLGNLDAGVDLFVRISRPLMGGEIKPHFGVTVKATDDSLPSEAAATAYINAHQDRPLRGVFLFPIVLFLFSMDGDQGYYSWLFGPSVTGEYGP